MEFVLGFLFLPNIIVFRTVVVVVPPKWQIRTLQYELSVQDH